MVKGVNAVVYGYDKNNELVLKAGSDPKEPLTKDEALHYYGNHEANLRDIRNLAKSAEMPNQVTRCLTCFTNVEIPEQQVPEVA